MLRSCIADVVAPAVAKAWIENFNASIQNGNIAENFLEESYWRDHLCLSWDFHCLQGSEKIKSFMKKSGIRIKSLAIDTSSELRSPIASPLDEGVIPVQTFLTVETDVGYGTGVVRLLQDQAGEWKAFTLYTCLTQLNGHGDLTGPRRPNGSCHIRMSSES